MKFLLIAVVLFFGTGSCYDYNKLLQETIDQIDLSMEMYTNSTLASFYMYSAENVGMQFKYFAETVAQSENQYAIEHVIDIRQNYSAIQPLLERMINDTRDEIVEVFTFQRESMTKLVPDIVRTADDVYEMLEQKYCNETMKEQFYINLVAMTGMRVTMTLSEGYQTYMTQLMSQLAPFMLYNYMINELTNCVNPLSGNQLETVDCMIQREDLYLSTTQELISNTMRVLAGLVNEINLKLTHQAMKDVEHTFGNAYRDAYIIKC